MESFVKLQRAFSSDKFDNAGLTKYEYAIIHVAAGYAANPFVIEANTMAAQKGFKVTPIASMAKATVDNIFKELNKDEVKANE